MTTPMPKDNEVDEKVEDFFERLYGMTFRLFLDPNSEEDEGNTVELRLGATVDNLALFETQDHAVLYTASTVADLRAEVERLVKALDEAACELSAAGQALAEFEGFEFRQKAAIDRAYAASQKAHDANGYTEALTGADPT